MRQPIHLNAGLELTLSAIGAIFCAEGVHAAEARAMLEALGEDPHDDAAYWHGGVMALAACTLHTTGESQQAAQPFVCEQMGLAAVFDGYLLNPEEVADDLVAKGVNLKTRAEVELALHAYAAWADGCAERLRGEFSFIVADLRKGQLFAARDHMGLIPLYYRREDDRLVVASDYRTLAAMCREPLQPDLDYLAQVLSSRFFLREATPWRGVKRVIRAHTLCFDGRALTTQNYWTAPTEVTIRYKRDEDYVDHYREVLFDCVRRASRTDRPLGVAVSGGLDSSALYTVADRLEQRGELQAPSFTGYSLSAGVESNAWELPFARAAAENLGRQLVEVLLFDPDIDWYTKSAERHLDLPIPSNGAMMLDLEKRVVADGARVLINGSGGDEWLQGDLQYYREFAREGDVPGFLAALRRDGAAFGWTTAVRQSFRQAIAELTPAPIRRAIRARLLARRRQGRGELFWLAPAMVEVLAKAEDDYEALLPENAIAWVKRNLTMAPFSDLSHSMMRRQRAGIGLTSRHPMLSRAFMEFALQTPSHIKRRGAIRKFVHREAMAGLLPEVIRNRTTKANFTNTKIDQQFADYVRLYGSQKLSGLCDEAGLSRLLEVDFGAPEGDHWAWEIWGLYASAAFLYQGKRNAHKSPPSPAAKDRNGES